MEVTTSAEALRRQRAAVGGSATTRAAARANAEQAPKPAMRKPTRLPHGEGSQRPGSERREHRPFPPGYWHGDAWKRGKEAPGFRFYSLSDKVWRDDVLAVAWQAVRRNGGAAGVDGETVADIESFGVDRWLGALARDLKEGTYRPRAVRQVLIPKKQRGTFRPLGIPCLRDRVAQTAAMLVLSPIFEADLQPEQYAYRPGRNAHDAVRRVHRLLTTGRREVVDADLSDYFGQIPHAELMKSIARRVSVTGGCWAGSRRGWKWRWRKTTGAVVAAARTGRVGSGRGSRRGLRTSFKPYHHRWPRPDAATQFGGAQAIRSGAGRPQAIHCSTVPNCCARLVELTSPDVAGICARRARYGQDRSDVVAALQEAGLRLPGADGGAVLGSAVGDVGRN